MPTFVITGKDGGRYRVTAPDEATARSEFAKQIGGQQEATPSVGWKDTALDVAKSIPSGIRLGYEGLAGIGGDVYNLQVTAAEKIAQMMGASPETMAEIKAARGKNWLPTSGDVAERVTNPIIGETHQPTTEPGRWAQTGASLVNPQTGVRNALRTVIAPTIGVEVGGDIGEAFGQEGAGRLAGGLAAAAAPGAAARSVAGPRVDPQQARHVNTLRQSDVPLTAGQATGRKALLAAETGPFEGKPAKIAQRQATGFNRAAMRRAGLDADLADPDTLNAARDSFGLEYEDLIARNNGVPMDSTLQDQLLDNTVAFQRMKGPTAPQVVEDFFERISGAARANNGVVPPDVFQSVRSDLSTAMRNTTDAEIRQALRQFQDSMFDSIARNGQPEIVAQARDLNNRYRNFKIIERTMGTSADAQKGNITPQALASAVNASDRGALAYGRGDMADLASAGAALLKPLPNSGTAARIAPYYGGGVGMAAGGQMMAGDALGALGTAAAGVAPWAMSSLLTSRPVQSSLIRQATNPMPALDPVTAALLMRQFQQQQGGGQ